MKLSQHQIDSYRTRGLLLVPDAFSASEVELLRERLPALYAARDERTVVEKDGAAVRSVYGSHDRDPMFDRLTRLPRLLEPARQLLGSEVYVYQFKVNAKKAFQGDVWPWHQDYVFWRNKDGLPRPDLVNVVLFLDEVHEFNGPLLFLPGSQENGLIRPRTLRSERDGEEGWRDDVAADLTFTLDQETVGDLVRRHGIEAPKGPAGSLLFFHPNIVHGSVTNISPTDRALVIATYCDVSNVATGGDADRPSFLVNRDARPLEPVDDDVLARVG